MAWHAGMPTACDTRIQVEAVTGGAEAIEVIPVEIEKAGSNDGGEDSPAGEVAAAGNRSVAGKRAETPPNEFA